jgi:hypothetical protein
MRFLEDMHFNDTNSGILLEVRLSSGWKDAAKQFPSERINEILAPSIQFSNRRLSRLKQIVEVSGGEYGLHHISFIGVRAGLDLFPEQNSYISQNLANGEQLSAILPIIIDYLKLLECVPDKKV